LHARVACELPEWLRGTPIVGRVASAVLLRLPDGQVPPYLVGEEIHDRLCDELSGLVRTILDEVGDLIRRNPEVRRVAKRLPARVFRDLQIMHPAYDASQGSLDALLRGLTRRAAARLLTVT
jgi:hypothetical protein